MTEPTSQCPDCGAALPDDSPQALCPACLMKQALASRTLGEGCDQAPAVPPLSPEELAEKFPGFEILECLGRGGMGVVYKARQKSLGRLVAIKILPPERVGEAKFADRFAIEAATLAKLSHPNIVTVHDFGIADSQPSTLDSRPLYYIVMEYVDGVNLRDLLREERLEPKQALAIVPPICDALQFAHDKGIVHRDIKPENLLLDRDGRVKIADFGIASLMGAAGEIAGTPPYMAPEQKGPNMDHRADIYALGVVLYEMLTGERPDKEIIAPSRKVRIDVRLDEMVLRALEKEPERRYQTASDFRTMVETMGASPVAQGSPAQLLKSGESLYATPEFLATVWGAMKLHEGMGTLLLFSDRLEFQAGLARRIIPLADIRRVDLVKYPFFQSPAGLRSIRLEFEDRGSNASLVLTPANGYFSFVGTTNRGVSEWFGALRDAISASTGVEPAGSAPAIPCQEFSSDGRFVSAFVMLASFTGLIGFLAAMAMTGSWKSVLPVSIPFIFGIAFVLALAWRQRIQWKNEHPLPAGPGARSKPGHFWQWLAAVVIAAVAIPLLVKSVVTPANRGSVSAVESLLRVTVRVLEAPKDFDDARLLRPSGLLDSGEVKVLAAPYVVVPSGSSGEIQIPEVALLAHGEGHLLSGRTRTLYVKPTLEPGTTHVRYTLDGDVRGTDANGDFRSRKTIRSDSLQLSEWQIMESNSDAGRRQLAVISVEVATGEIANRVNVPFEKPYPSPGSPQSPQKEPEKANPAEKNALESVENIDAINDTNRFLDLELAVIDAKANGLGDNHPTVTAASEVLARFKQTNPNVPDAVWRQLVGQRLEKAKEDLLALTQNGLGHAHPTVVAQQARIRALTEMFGKPEVPGANVITLSANGEVSVAGQPCPPNQLDGRLKELVAKNFQSIVIRPEAGTLLNRILELQEACKAAGLDPDLTKSTGLFSGDADLNNIIQPGVPSNQRDRMIIEDLALRMIVAIREKDDAKLKSLAADRIKGWPESLPAFAVELREHYRQIIGDEKFEMKAGESLVDGDLGAVRCTGPAALEGKCIVMLFVKTEAGWKNQLLRAATENTALTELLADFRKQMEKAKPAEKPPGN